MGTTRLQVLYSPVLSLFLLTDEISAFASLEGISNPTPSRQSLFAHFTTSLLPQLRVPPDGPAILLTGGLHNRDIIASSLRNRACDLVGIGRPACVKPALPVDIILNREIEAEQTGLGSYKIKGGEAMRYIFGGGRSATASTPGKPAVSSYTETGTTLYMSKEGTEGKRGIPLVGAGISTTWHEWQLCRIGRGVEPDMDMSWFWGGLIVEGLWWGLLRGGPWRWWTDWITEDRLTFGKDS